MKTWRTAWRNLTKEAELPGLRFPWICGTIALCSWLKRECQNQTLMAIVGHVSREMLEHCSHIRMQAKREAVAALEPPKAQATVQSAAADAILRHNGKLRPCVHAIIHIGALGGRAEDDLPQANTIIGCYATNLCVKSSKAYKTGPSHTFCSIPSKSIQVHSD